MQRMAIYLNNSVEPSFIFLPFGLLLSSYRDITCHSGGKIMPSTASNPYRPKQTHILHFAFLIAVVLGSAWSAVSAPKEIIVSAAASLKNAFEELAPIYEKKTGVHVNYNFAASGVLQQQIEAGAPADVFASAAEKQMNELEKKDLLLKGTRQDFTGNSLVLILPADSKIPVKEFSDLERPEVARLSIGNPKTVPAGQYAQEALTSLKLWDKLQSRFILAENVRQVLDYVARGEVEAGLVYASDAAIAKQKIRVVATAPKDLHTAIIYPIAVIGSSSNSAAAKKFIDLVLSKTGQTILARYGFTRAK
jgi:molybdate transport system substrate-binding protein